MMNVALCVSQEIRDTVIFCEPVTEEPIAVLKLNTSGEFAAFWFVVSFFKDSEPKNWKK